MHESVLEYVGTMIAEHDLGDLNVLEIGSLDVNGSARNMFTNHYVGIDLTEGPGVDIVADWHDQCNRWVGLELILCLEMLEHDTRPWVTAHNIAACLAPDGFAIVTARGYVGRHAFPEHLAPHDYWRFSVEGMRHLLEWAGLEVVDCRPDPEAPGVFATARAK